jgi:hypothetical protein
MLHTYELSLGSFRSIDVLRICLVKSGFIVDDVSFEAKSHIHAAALLTTHMD